MDELWALIDPRTVGAALRALLSDQPLLAIGLIVFIEELGVPIPVPADLMMLLGGIYVARGEVSLLTLLAVEMAATLVGASLLYLVSRRVGRPLVVRYGHLAGLDAPRFQRLEHYLQRRSGLAVFVGRLFPGLRVATVFLPALALSSLVYIGGWTALGMVAGPPALEVAERVQLPAAAIVSLIVLGTAVFAMRRVSDGVLAQAVGGPLRQGLAAGVAALLVSNVTVGGLNVAVQILYGSDGLEFTGAPGELRLLLGWPLFLLFAVGTSYLAASALGRRLPRPLRVLLTALAPFAAVVLLVHPLAAPPPDGAILPPRMIATITTLARWVAFALVLEWLRARYASRSRAGAVEVEVARSAGD
jgi:membrane protein DedA with SNARE-associated domain